VEHRFTILVVSHGSITPSSPLGTVCLKDVCLSLFINSIRFFGSLVVVSPVVLFIVYYQQQCLKIIGFTLRIAIIELESGLSVAIFPYHVSHANNVDRTDDF
jgi:hypothetical protein